METVLIIINQASFLAIIAFLCTIMVRQRKEISDLIDRLMARSFEEYKQYKVAMEEASSHEETKSQGIVRDDVWEYAVSQGIEPTPENLHRLRETLGGSS